MPTYEYQCDKCGKQFEKTTTLKGHEVKPACPACGSHNVHQVPATFQAVTEKKT